MSIFVDGNLDDQDGYHASHVADVRQITIIHHMHLMNSHIQHMHMNTFIKRGEGTIKALVNQLIK